MNCGRAVAAWAVTLVWCVAQAAAQGQAPGAGRAQGPADLTQRSVAKGEPTGGTVNLTLAGAIDLALQQNLGVLLGKDAVVSRQGEEVQALSRLLPNVSARLAETAAQINLAAQGFQKVAGRFPGGGFPLIVGPFGYVDVRAYLSQAVVDFNALHQRRAAAGSTEAERLSLQDVREVVALAAGAAYLDASAAAARVDAAQAQLETAQALYNQAADLRNAGLSAGIDLLRAQVELQTRQQQLIAARNAEAKQKIVLARIIGLPLGQQFRLAEEVPFAAVAAPGVEEAVKRALSARADFQSAQARVKAAQERLRAVTAEHLPSLAVAADYGVIGPTPGQTHGSFSASASLHIPIFSGNRVHGEALAAQAEIERSREQEEDLKGQIEQEVRTAELDLQAAEDQVRVAQSRRELAGQTLAQARDRFAAGVTDNIEIVQAQEAVALAEESYISSLRDYNLARMQLSRVTGSAEKDIRQMGKGK